MNDLKFETLAIRSQLKKSSFNEHSAPLYLTSSFVFDDAEQMRAMFADEIEGNIYSRFSNPNTTELIDKICLLECAEAGWATASGMSAVFTTFGSLLKQGDHLLSCKSIFGSTHNVISKILPKWGIDYSYFDVNNISDLENLIQPNTKIIFIETPTNPVLDVLDLAYIGEICKKRNLIFIVDNCFATPYIQQPIKFGADLVIHSATKYLDGQGRVVGGLIAGKKSLINEIQTFARHSGPSMSPFNAWIISKSIETLAIRMEKHCENALKVAQFLESHNHVLSVKYPFLPSHPQYAIAKKQMKLGGGLVAFEIKGGIEAGKKFLNQIQWFSLTANLGDVRTIVTHPASTTHSKLSAEERLETGITDGLIRISVGIENIDDILEELNNALN